MFGLRQSFRKYISKALLFCLVTFLVTVHRTGEFIIVSCSSRQKTWRQLLEGGQRYPLDNHFLSDSTIRFPNTYPLESDFSGGQSYPSFEQPGPEIVLFLSASRIYDKFNISTRGKKIYQGSCSLSFLLHSGRSPGILLCLSGPRIYNRFSMSTRRKINFRKLFYILSDSPRQKSWHIIRHERSQDIHV